MIVVTEALKRIFRPLQKFLRFVLQGTLQIIEDVNLQIAIERECDRLKEGIRARDGKSLALSGHKIYSQNDEDGIIAEIFDRIGVRSRLFCEIGAADGLENNTHALLLKDWRGVWVEGSKQKTDFIAGHFPLRGRKLVVANDVVDRDNVDDVLRDAFRALGETAFPLEVDFLSIDIDGNDLYVLERLASLDARVVCVEYNAKYPPPMRIAIAYDDRHQWRDDDYQGASLQCFVELLKDRGYALVCCGLAGVNAFFVKADQIRDIELRPVAQLYQPARYHLRRQRAGHPPSLKHLANVIRG